MLRLKDQKLINLNLRLRLEPIHCVTLGTSGALLSKKKKKNTLRIKMQSDMGMKILNYEAPYTLQYYKIETF